MRKTLTVRLEKTTRTDLLCIICGCFRTDAAIVGSEFAGVHRRCIARRARGSRERTPEQSLEA